MKGRGLSLLLTVSLFFGNRVLWGAPLKKPKERYPWTAA